MILFLVIPNRIAKFCILLGMDTVHMKANNPF
jgi:hypothetical protein